jgi:hypothetical protein
VLGERLLALDLELGAAVAGGAMEEDRLLDRGHERVADAAEHRVVGPDREVVLPADGQLPGVMREVALRVLGVDPERRGHARVHLPAPRLHLHVRDEGVGRRMAAVLVHEPDRVEDLHGAMGVEARHDLRDRAEVAVDEVAETAVVVDGSGSRTPSDEELEARDAEGVLDVDGEQAHLEAVLARGPQVVFPRPVRRLAGTLLVGDSP